MLRIYGFADLHDRINRLKEIQEIVRAYRPHVIVCAGDSSRSKKAADIYHFFEMLSMPIFFINGNAETFSWVKRPNKTRNLNFNHLKKIQIKEWSFVGIDGAIPMIYQSKVAFNEKKLFRQIEPLISKNTVLIAHPPPWGTLDKALGIIHAGSRLVRNLILDQKPKLFLCGHIHEARGQKMLGETLVVNCAMGYKNRGAIIDLKNDDTRVEWI